MTSQPQPKQTAQVLRFRKPRRKPVRQQQSDLMRRRAEVEQRNRMAL